MIDETLLTLVLGVTLSPETAAIAWQICPHLSLVLATILLVLATLGLAKKWVERLDQQAELERMEEDEAKRRKDAVVTAMPFLVLTLLGLFVTAEAALLCFDGGGRMFTAVLWALAANEVGALMGFLFALPKSGNGDVYTDGRTKVSAGRINTSLEQITDWLTKIIVGVSLVQTREIYAKFKVAVNYFAAGLDAGNSASQTFAAAVLVFFPIVGFLGTYLITRLYLAEVISDADVAATGGTAIAQADTTEENVDTARASARVQLADQIRLDQQRVAAAPTREIQLGGAVQKIAEKFKGISFDALKTWEDYAAWGVSQFALGNASDAVRAYERATALRPDDPALLFEYAAVLDKVRQGEKATEALEKALEKLPNDKDEKLTPEQSKLRADVFNSLTFRYLYVGTKEALEKAIKCAKRFLDIATEGPSSGPLLVNLACAYGQIATARARDKGLDKNGAEFKQLRAEAYNAAKKAIDLDTSWRSRLRFLLDPLHPDKQAYPEKFKDEDDLEVFADDTAFCRLVGAPERLQQPGAAV